MHEQAGRCIARASRAAALAGALGAMVAGCGGSSAASGSFTSPSTAPTHAAAKSPAPSREVAVAAKPVTPGERKMAAIINAWSVRLNRNDNMGVAELYSLPTIIVQAPYAYRLTTRSEVALFFSELPCSGTVLSILYHGKYATAVFRLGNRGTAPCDNPGGLAAARFEIVKGKIVSWTQVPVPKGAAKIAPVA
jgi:hypothetical protein